MEKKQDEDNMILTREEFEDCIASNSNYKRTLMLEHDAEMRLQLMQMKLELDSVLRVHDEVLMRADALYATARWEHEGVQLLTREVFGFVNGSWGCRDPKKYIRQRLDEWLSKKPLDTTAEGV
jgi:hypothetical protein